MRGAAASVKLSAEGASRLGRAKICKEEENL